MFKSQQFIHKVTGEIVTQVPIMQMNQYREYYGICNSCGTEKDKHGRCGASDND